MQDYKNKKLKGKLDLSIDFRNKFLKRETILGIFIGPACNRSN